MYYTYLIGWSKYNKWYYGVRVSSKCKMTDLWTTYFTSSKYVKEFRKLHGEPNVIQIRKMFSDKNKALLFEEKVIRRLNMVHSEKWLNRGNSGSKFKCPEIHPMTGKHHKPESILKMKASALGRKHSITTKEKMRLAKIGKPGPRGMLGKNHSEETKIKISRSRKKYLEKTCQTFDQD